MNRRDFLARCLLTALMTSDRRAFDQDLETFAPITLTVTPDAAGTVIPLDFLGLSYESSLIPTPDFFSVANTPLLTLMKRLGPQGVLRIGGNSSEFSRFQPDRTPPVVPPNLPPRAHLYAITPDDIARLATFVHASGWKLIYGLNLGTGTPQQAAAAAEAVAQAVGPSLLAFQIGNEPDLFGHNGLRPRTYSVADYHAEWKTFAEAVQRRIPHAPFAGPDTASPNRWFSTVAQQDAKGLALLTQHYYTEGPGSSPKSTIARMLSARGRLAGELRTLQDTARRAGRPWRMAETNSVYGGGRYGVSDTLAAALWGADYLFHLAEAGCAGANFHGGTHGAYTPLARVPDSPGLTPRPLYYGMMLFAQAAQGRLVPARLTGAPPSLTAYAANAGDALRVTVINTDDTQPAHLTIDPGRKYPAGNITRLTGNALDSPSGVTLGGTTVSPDGVWTPTQTEHPQFTGQRFALDVPAASAVTVHLQ